MTALSDASHQPEKEVYWAVIGYARWWLAHDAGLLQMVKAGDNRLDEDSLTAIARTYGVARGLPGKKEEQENDRKLLLETLNKANDGWPEGLLARAKYCGQIAAKLKNEEITGRRDKDGVLKGTAPVSAVTKLMWFLQPKGWTVFDQWAADGMGVPRHLGAQTRMRRFYQALHEAGFDETRDELQGLADRSDWPSLHAARILDFLVMRRGYLRQKSGASVNGTNALPSLPALQGFLDALPSAASKSLRTLANRAQEELGNDILLPSSLRGGKADEAIQEAAE